MSFYEGIKDAIGLAQKADNIELYKQLLDLGAQALELQAEIARLTAENEELRKTKDIESRIIRHEQPFITLTSENSEIRYCGTCWSINEKLVQLLCYKSGEFKCPVCQTKGIYDEVLCKKDKEKQLQMIKSMNPKSEMIPMVEAWYENE